jgi:hypothetical protein
MKNAKPNSVMVDFKTAEQSLDSDSKIARRLGIPILWYHSLIHPLKK